MTLWLKIKEGSLLESHDFTITTTISLIDYPYLEGGYHPVSTFPVALSGTAQAIEQTWKQIDIPLTLDYVRSLNAGQQIRLPLQYTIPDFRDGAHSVLLADRVRIEVEFRDSTTGVLLDHESIEKDIYISPTQSRLVKGLLTFVSIGLSDAIVAAEGKEVAAQLVVGKAAVDLTKGYLSLSEALAEKSPRAIDHLVNIMLKLMYLSSKSAEVFFMDVYQGMVSGLLVDSAVDADYLALISIDFVVKAIECGVVTLADAIQRNLVTVKEAIDHGLITVANLASCIQDGALTIWDAVKYGLVDIWWGIRNGFCSATEAITHGFLSGLGISASQQAMGPSSLPKCVPSSSLELLVTDDLGQRAGLMNGEILEEIPGAFVTLTDEGDVEIWLPEDIGSYSLIVRAASKGNLGLKLVFPDREVSHNAQEVIYAFELTPGGIVKGSSEKVEKGAAISVDVDGDGVVDEQREAEAAFSFAMGDVNYDGLVNLSDIRIIYQAALGFISLDLREHTAADVDGDGVIELDDAEVLSRWLMEMEEQK